jgi:hypothetical protein
MEGMPGHAVHPPVGSRLAPALRPGRLVPRHRWVAEAVERKLHGDQPVPVRSEVVTSWSLSFVAGSSEPVAMAGHSRVRKQIHPAKSFR